MSIETEKIIDSLIAERKKKGLSQTELALACSIPQPSIGRIESKKVEPKLDTLVKIASALGCTVSISSK